MVLQIGWHARPTVGFEVARRSDQNVPLWSDTLRGQRTVVQHADADRHVEPVRNHVDDPIGEMGVDPDVRMLCQKRCEGRGNPLPPKGHG
jgi:hypothetical protein